jgi:hypothetical protein
VSSNIGIQKIWGRGSGPLVMSMVVPLCYYYGGAVQDEDRNGTEDAVGLNLEASHLCIPGHF